MKIIAARITPLPLTFMDPLPRVYVTLDIYEEERFLFDYYPNEISFTASEFVGLTLEEAHALKFKKDRDYLSPNRRVQ